jgi:molybdate/tungstate transport system substrate-binding protein
VRLAAALVLLAALAGTVGPARADAPAPVSVLYAGSLIVPMEGPVAVGAGAQGIEFQGEPGGSKQLAQLILSGRRTPDVFISADRESVAMLGDKVASSTTFASSELGIGWDGKSNYAYALEGVGKGEMPLLVGLAQPGLRLGRTDPAKDPKGQLTIDALALLLGPPNEKRVLGIDENPAQLYAEHELVARILSGEIDVGFMYETEAASSSLEFMPFPGEASMSDRIAFTLAIMKDAPHPAQARAFADYILSGPGREILQKAGLKYLKRAADTR